MKEFFAKEFYSNTVAQWLTALFIVLGVLILSRVVYWFFSKIVRIFTRRTKTRLDDILIDKIEEPIVIGIVIAGIWYGSSYLTMTAQVRTQLEGLVYLAIILNFAWLIVRTVDALIEEYILPIVEQSDSNLDDAILPIARRGFSIIIWVVAVVIGLNNAGYDVATILAGLGIGGLALAIGARTTIMNIFGGITVLIAQPFKIGDRIMIGEYDGFVEHIGLSITQMRTFIDNFVVTIPNRIFADQEVVNVTEARGVKVDLALHIPVTTSPEVIQEILDFMHELVFTHPELNRDTKITVKGLDDYSIVLQFIYYVRPGAPFWQIRSEVALTVFKHLQHIGVPLATRNGVNYFPEDIQRSVKPKSKVEIKKIAEDEEGVF
jgi:MscS family membrane protein